MTPSIATAASARQLAPPPAPGSAPVRSQRPGASADQKKSADPSNERDPLFDYDDAPPWLISLITHMALIILLGLWIQHAPVEPGFELTLNLSADPGLTTFDAGGGDLGDEPIDVAFAGDPADETADDPAEIAVADPTLTQLVDVQADALLAASPVAESFAVDAASLMAESGGSLAGDASSGAGGGSGGGQGPSKGAAEGPGHVYTSMFGLAGEGGDFVYAFDRSQSMNSVFTSQIDGNTAVKVTPLEAAKNELTRSIGDLNEECRFQVVFYNDIAVLFGGEPTLAKATFPNKELVKSFIYDMPAESNTNHMIAMEKALECRPQILFLLTDGEEKDDPTASEVRRLVRECKRLKIKINVVHFCFEVRETCTLIELARGTGGEHRFITLRELAKQKLDTQRGTPTLRAVEMPPPLE